MYYGGAGGGGGGLKKCWGGALYWKITHSGIVYGSEAAAVINHGSDNVQAAVLNGSKQVALSKD